MNPDQRLEAWKDHYRNWRHCLRCKYADWRMLTDPDINKRATPVPMPGSFATHAQWRAPELVARHPLVLLLPFPDAVQSYFASPLGNLKERRRYWSPQVNALLAVWESLEGMLPYKLEEIPIVTSVGCRPVNFKRTREVVPPAQTVLTSCRRRWQEQLMLVDPLLVLSFGHWSHASLYPSRMKKGDFTDDLGEVRPFEIPTSRGGLTYTAYTAISPYEVANSAREDQWVAPFQGKPVSSTAKHPVEALRWQIYHACWITKVLEISRQEGTLTLPSPEDGLEHWVSMVTSLNQYYGDKEQVQTAVSQVSGYVDYLTMTEESAQSVRLAQLGTIPAERPKTHTFSPKIGRHHKRKKMEDSTNDLFADDTLTDTT